MEDMRDRVVQVLLEHLEEGLPIVGVVSDSTSTSRIAPLQKQFPDKVINVGIAEQSLVGTAAGLSLGGFVPYTANAAPFLLTRSAEQLRNDLCYSDLNVKMLGLNAGVAYGPLGSTHHSIEDLGLLRSWGNVQIFTPADATEAAAVTDYASRNPGPMYIRMDSGNLPLLHKDNFSFQPGEPVCYCEGKDLVIFALGSLVHEALSAVALGLEATVVNLLSIRPLNEAAVIKIVRQHKNIICLEEHSVQTGLASLLSKLMIEGGILRNLTALGFDSFATAEPRSAIRRGFRLDAQGILSVAEGLATNV